MEVATDCYLAFVLFASEEVKEEEKVWWTVRSPRQGAAGDLSRESWTMWAGVWLCRLLSLWKGTVSSIVSSRERGLH